MCQHPNGDIMATGSKATYQDGQTTSCKDQLVDIKIWKSSTLELIIEIRGFHKRAVRILAFSPDGSKLLSVG